MSKNKASVSKIKASTKSPVVSASQVKESIEPPPASASPARMDRLSRVSVLLPIALAFLFSVNTLWLGFACDDQQQVLNNIGIKDFKNLLLAFTSTVWGFANLDNAITVQPDYQPLWSVWSLMNYALFGTRAWGWHLMNVFIHMAATYLVFVVCRKFTGRKQLALITASLFAVHPVHTQAVTWISGIADPFMSVFLLLAFYFYLQWKETGKFYWMGALLAAYLLALGCKETALALPLVIVYLELAHFNNSESLTQRLTRSAILTGELLLPIVIFILMRRQALGTFFYLEDLRYPFWAALLTMPLATLKYLALTFVPYGYSYQHYTNLISSATSLAFILPLALLIILACAITLRASRLVKFASVWFFAFLLPSLVAIRNFDPEYVVQERYLYLPSMGACMLVGLAIERLAAQRFFVARKGALLAITSAVVLILGLAQIRYSFFWRDSLSVFQRCVAVAPDSAAAYATLSGLYYPMGKMREAEAAAQTALQLDPTCTSAYLNLSYILKQSGKLDEAIETLDRAKTRIGLTPTTRTALATTTLNLGLLYNEKKDFAQAEENLRQSLALWERASSYYSVGQVYLAQNKDEEALKYFEKAAQLVPPRSTLIHITLGSLYEKLKQNDKALAEYRFYLEHAAPNAQGRKEISRRIAQLQIVPKRETAK